VAECPALFHWFFYFWFFFLVPQAVSIQLQAFPRSPPEAYIATYFTFLYCKKSRSHQLINRLTFSVASIIRRSLTRFLAQRATEETLRLVSATGFHGMHYGNTLGVLACLRLCCVWFKTFTTVMSMSWRMVIRLLVCVRLVGLSKVAPCLLCFFPFTLTILTTLLRVYQGLSPEPRVCTSHTCWSDFAD